MKCKADFPIFKNTGVVYLDSGATTQKPACVINAEKTFYENNNANIHRGVYKLSEAATKLYEDSREKTRQFINAKNTHEIIFTKGTTESINLIAHSFGISENIKPDDEIMLSIMEHHSNIVPWQMLCEKTGATLKVIPILENGEIDLNFYENNLSHKTKLISLIHISNVLGTLNPIKKMIAIAHQKNIPVLIDGAQAVAHIPVDVQDLDCDFYVFSSHKLYGPTGVGVLYGKTSWLEKMPPYQTGGDMISSVSFEKTTFNVLPYKFEAGTPNIAGVVALKSAIEFIESIGFDNIISHEKKLLEYATHQLSHFKELKIFGNASNKIGIISFVFDSVHPHDVATILAQSNVAIRAGHHCAMPLINFLGVPALSRISLGIYNDESDIDALVEALKNVEKIFHV